MACIIKIGGSKDVASLSYIPTFPGPSVVPVHFLPSYMPTRRVSSFEGDAVLLAVFPNLPATDHVPHLRDLSERGAVQTCAVSQEASALPSANRWWKDRPLENVDDASSFFFLSLPTAIFSHSSHSLAISPSTVAMADALAMRP